MFLRRIKDDHSAQNDTIAYLKSSLKEADIKISLDVQEKMLKYVALMIKWNRAYNLTSVREPKQIIARHLMDSLSILPYLQGEQILDIGTGAGLPGIPLALLNPYSDFVLVDSNGKKTRFLAHVVNDLELDNVTVVNDRVESYKPGYRFDAIISRAFSSIREMVTLSQHLCAKNGMFLAMKGIYPAAEMSDIPPGFQILGVHELKVPGVEDERSLVCLTQTNN